MQLNISKCKVIRITRRLHSTHYSYHLKGVPLNSAYKYLAINITNGLSWNMHVDYVTCNANHTLGYLQCNFSKVPSSLKVACMQFSLTKFIIKIKS